MPDIVTLSLCETRLNNGISELCRLAGMTFSIPRVHNGEACSVLHVHDRYQVRVLSDFSVQFPYIESLVLDIIFLSQ